ncbi:MAG: DNA primase, partial [Planctomycetota bacterium]
MDRFEEVKLRIKDSLDLVAVVEAYVPLKARGRYRVGLCPFHREKTPSFTVYPDTQHFKCYGCGKAGDIFTFVMEREGLSFREAMETLAERAGLSTDGLFVRGRGDKGRRADVHATLGKVRDWLTAALASAAGQSARSYLEMRGLEDAVTPFGLGFHPVGDGLQELASKQGLPRDVLVQAGLLTADGRHERFAGRLMFPIEDERGRVVGFGGRVLQAGSSKAKYINSSESPFFNKRRLLFGLRQAKQAGVRRLVVMEGYTDVIAAHLAGQAGAVATLGTALTQDHARLLERYATDGVVLLFDGDRAGRQACDRAFRELVHTRLPVRMALLPDGHDPADLARAGGGELQALVDGAEDALVMWFRLLRQRLDLTLDVNVERAAAECARIIRGIQSPVRRDALVQTMSRHLGVQAGSLAQLVRGLLRSDATRASAATEPAVQEPAGGALAQAEMDLLACLLADPALHTELRGLTFHTPGIAELVAMIADGLRKGHAAKEQIVGYVFTRCADREDALGALLARCCDRASPPKDPQTRFSQLQHDLRA